jgi:signal transduction histidine kinase
VTEPFDPEELVWTAAEAARLRVGADTRIDVSIPAVLPKVEGDPERTRQVLTNLVDNAIKYSPAGDEVRVTAGQENGAIRIAVIDHGPGIPHDQQRLIFEKFGRAEVPGGSKPGTGLGLFIARSIAEAHGGTIDVRSRPSEGATFVLTLPVTRS